MREIARVAHPVKVGMLAQLIDVFGDQLTDPEAQVRYHNGKLVFETPDPQLPATDPGDGSGNGRA